MKTALHIFPGFGIGGAQRRFAQIASGLRGWRHHVIALNGETGAMDLCGAAPVTAEAAAGIGPSRGLSLSNIGKLRGSIREAQAELLCTYNWGSIEAVAANRLGLGLPHVHFEDGFGPDEAVKRSTPRNVLRQLLLSKSQVVVPSTTLRTIASREWRIAKERLVLIPNGINTRRFSPPPSRSVSGQPVIGTVAALRPEKALDRLIRGIAGSGIPFRLEVVGDGPEREGLERLARAVGVSATFHGATDDTSSFYKRFDIFALSSDTEQMPLTVIEAMASGLPVVATQVGDIGPMVGEGNRPFIVPRDEAMLATALRGLTADPAAMARIGAENRAKALGLFSQDTMLRRYQELFDRVAS